MRKSTKLMVALGVVAGIGVASAPLTTRAANTEIGRDTLGVNVESSCSLKVNTVSFQGTWTATMPAGDEATLAPAGGSSAATISCNEHSKFEILAQGTPLTLGTNDDTIALNMWKASFQGSEDISFVTPYGANYVSLPSSESRIAYSNDAGTENTFTVTGYKVQTRSDQKSGHYEGHAIYTFALLDEAVSGD